MKRRRLAWFVLAACLGIGLPLSVQGADAPAAPTKSKYDTLIEGSKAADGLWNMHYKDQQLLVDIPAAHLNRNFIVLTSIAKGISRGAVLGGMSWNFGDDAIWTFRKVGDKLHVIRRNVRFRANEGSPEGNAVKLAYSDSVLYALPILTTTPSGGSLVDMTRIFMSDDEGIGRSIGPGFFFASDRSTWAKVKAFPQNVELQVAAVYSGGGEIDTVADSRGVQVNVHYSISMLPTNGYKPRKADDRVGYFLTVLKDFSDKGDDQHFVRYINRWNLQKADPSASLSPPKEPIIFYLERTVPISLRPIVRSGIEEWNKAFAKLGYANAIEVRQQRDDDDWDPEDVRYNTFRWITADAGFAMGPSRVNPMTGQILDADIIFDAGFLQHWKTDYETFTADDVAALMGGAPAGQNATMGMLTGHSHSPGASCAYCRGMQQQMAFAATVMQVRDPNAAKKLPDELIAQGLKEVVMHEVGHTLGLRHNFKASSWKSLADIDDPVKGAAEGTVASVMDYAPANIAPKGVKQGLYYTQTIGPYDYWAIEYGYKQIAGDEDKELAKIASRSAEPGLDYSTDEDTRGVDADPLSNRFDLGADPVEFAKRQMALASELMPQVVNRSVEDGQGYQRARQAFGIVFSQYWQTAYFASRFPGGIYVHRDHKGDPQGRAPNRVVEPAKQRAAMKLLSETAFSTQTYPPEVLNYLAATRWNHWGVRDYSRLDYPIHDFVGMMQQRILYQLLNPMTLSRLQDSELKVAADADAYTLAEHMRGVVDAVFGEFKGGTGEFTVRKPYVSSFRRNLQRATVKELAFLVNSASGAPEDARTLARYHLGELDKQITALLAKGDLKLDDYSRAHLLDTQERIHKALQASVILPSIN
ncbi:MAG TPA: zinc-dependent metalloprotease [Planctomycetaceae bacterium]|nr:zinc-dependent metalloprotease [Planctomycetaceae bacterium]